MGVLLLFIWELSAQQVSWADFTTPTCCFRPLERDSRWLFSPSYIDYSRWTNHWITNGLVFGVLLGIIIGKARFEKCDFLCISSFHKLFLKSLWLHYSYCCGLDMWYDVENCYYCFDLLFPLLEATASAIQHVNSDQLTLFRLMNASWWQTYGI